MRLRIEAIASYSGLKGIFKLLGADIYEVLSVEPIADEVGARRRPPAARRRRREPDAVVHDEGAAGPLATASNARRRLDGLLDSILETLESLFGFRHSMILLAGEQPDRLVTIASRGYPEGGVGSEVRIRRGHHRHGGRGAEADPHLRPAARHALRQRGRASARARQAAGARTTGASRCPAWPIPRASSACRCSCAASWSACCASRARRRTASTRRTRPRSSCSGRTWRSRSRTCSCRSESRERRRSDRRAGGGRRRPTRPRASATEAACAREVGVLPRATSASCVDGEYLIRSLPARILWKLLTRARARRPRRVHQPRAAPRQVAAACPSSRTTSRRRLLLLRRRLEEKCPDIRLVPPRPRPLRARGRR